MVAAIDTITVCMPHVVLGCCPLNKFPRLILDPLVDVGVVACSMLHKLVLHLCHFSKEVVVFHLEGRVLMLQSMSRLFQVVHPLLFLLSTLGCRYPVAFQELAPFRRPLAIHLFLLLFLLFLDNSLFHSWSTWWGCS